MYNRYQGNSGRVERVPDAPQPSIRPRPPAPPAGNNKPPPGLPASVIQDGIQFCMTHKEIFIVQRITDFSPWHDIVFTSGRHTIIPFRQNTIIIVYNTCTNLSGRIFASLC